MSESNDAEAAILETYLLPTATCDGNLWQQHLCGTYITSYAQQQAYNTLPVLRCTGCCRSSKMSRALFEQGATTPTKQGEREHCHASRHMTLWDVMKKGINNGRALNKVWTWKGAHKGLHIPIVLNTRGFTLGAAWRFVSPSPSEGKRSCTWVFYPFLSF